MFTDQLPALEELCGRVRLPADVVVGERSLCDLEMLLNGALRPLEGYMTLSDYVNCVNQMTLADGCSVFTLPVVLPVNANECELSDGPLNSQVVHIRNNTNALIADLEVTSVFVPHFETEVTKVLNEQHPENPTHPYALYLQQAHANCFYVGGRLVERLKIVHFDYTRYRLTPQETRTRFAERGWRTVVGFQTRNPMHRSHYELTREAMREVERETGKPCHLMISPAVGPTQPGDVDYRVRVRCYERILAHYPEEPLLVLLPLAMRMAGPREAVHHALIRKNYGCTHFIVGRDHAGPSCKTRDGQSFYEPYAAHQLLDQLAPTIGIKPVFGKNMCYCGEELGYLQQDQVPEGVKTQMISGTEFRRMLEQSEPVPSWFCFEDVADELRAEYVPRHKRGMCVYFTGLPCSGKSTLAEALRAVLLESRNERRKITVLDADVIRTHLSKGLGFSREDRSMNVRRIGYVAQEVVKHGGICLVANIAPYKADRMYNRRLVESVGGHYVEIFVSTPLEVCEQRDIKQLYKKARAGVLKQFTGISDPYEEPEHAELTINSSTDLADKVRVVHDYLRERGLCL